MRSRLFTVTCVIACSSLGPALHAQDVPGQLPPPPPPPPPSSSPQTSPPSDPQQSPAPGAAAPDDAPDDDAASGAAEAAPAEPTPDATPAAKPAPDAPAAEPAGDCVPACRSGYVCLQGQCVEACNPPCEANQRCTDAGECVVREPAGSGVPEPFFPSDGTNYALPPVEHDAEMHDGFMLRLTLGLGGGGARYDVNGMDVVLDGGGVSFSLDIGGSPAENLVIHGRLANFRILEPTVTIDDEEVGHTEDESFGFALLGPGLTYYFMPINVYVTAVVGLSYGTGDDGEQDDTTTDAGWALNLDVGKEWWVGDQWGLGVAGRLWYSSVPDETVGGEDIDVELVAGGVLFSATYQ